MLFAAISFSGTVRTTTIAVFPINSNIEHFEFGARKPREAIIEEIREKGSGVVGLHHKIPTVYFKSGDKFLEQPVSVEFDVESPAKVELPANAVTPPK